MGSAASDPFPRSAGSVARRSRRSRYELRLTRTDSATSLVVRSRHRFRFLAEWSRRLDTDHVRLLPGCELVVVDVRNGPLRPPAAVIGSTRRVPRPVA